MNTSIRDSSKDKKKKMIYPVVEERPKKVPAVQLYQRQARNRQQRARKREIYRDENSSNSDIVDLN